MKKLLLLALSIVVLTSSARAAVTITMNYDLGDDTYDVAGDSTVSVANQTIFNNATAFWQGVLTGYVDGGSRTITIHASTFSQAASGGGVLLGSAGPRDGFIISASGMNYVMVSEGAARFNVHPDAVGGGGLLNELTIRHEIGHILGIGTLWSGSAATGGITGLQELYTSGTGQYTGANALAAYNAEFGKSGAFIPIELDGGGGTANGHWNEVTDNFAVENAPGFDSHPGDGVAAPTVVAGVNAGQSMDNELMTGVLSGSGFLSDTTIGSFRDLGYTTIAFSVPEPSSGLVAVLGCFVMLRRKRSMAA